MLSRMASPQAVRLFYSLGTYLLFTPFLAD